ncbi:hypothetical protein CALVIDRAFT_382748 [Calocera viscosa TUFC12733]|uniref:Uncharacterized protein n=1 Tax=Calocera viscosa (strain TUFC12733) TaxID=1330018 RepID=A0A167Q6K3_CALVF|nr:hypothetical protein CALVIDRAFT_382748 [Calocera viscosa TUFC12733]
MGYPLLSDISYQSFASRTSARFRSQVFIPAFRFFQFSDSASVSARHRQRNTIPRLSATKFPGPRYRSSQFQFSSGNDSRLLQPASQPFPSSRSLPLVPATPLLPSRVKPLPRTGPVGPRCGSQKVPLEERHATPLQSNFCTWPLCPSKRCSVIPSCDLDPLPLLLHRSAFCFLSVWGRRAWPGRALGRGCCSFGAGGLAAGNRSRGTSSQCGGA